MAIFEGALVRLRAQAKQLAELATAPMPNVIGMPLEAAEIVIRSATGTSRIGVIVTPDRQRERTWS
jgi:hypothetical protein